MDVKEVLKQTLRYLKESCISSISIRFQNSSSTSLESILLSTKNFSDSFLYDNILLLRLANLALICCILNILQLDLYCFARRISHWLNISFSLVLCLQRVSQLDTNFRSGFRFLALFTIIF
ncbi:hypothetical protein RCL_jg28462.t1 [Rhizophagus clarus]|uniref:Uncharacterized protein n=1 Tax=Rhizophagus clarus TaxID=94130 RepID=A0A8H3QIU0_9GLOM|nr:hypothetical protein RCL_jg28462.t1 [Rhizophagus clarus]